MDAGTAQENISSIAVGYRIPLIAFRGGRDPVTKGERCASSETFSYSVLSFSQKTLLLPVLLGSQKSRPVHFAGRLFYITRNAEFFLLIKRSMDIYVIYYL